MTPEETELHSWNRAREQRENEKAQREARQFLHDYSSFSRKTKLLIPLFLAIIAGSQAYLAWMDHSEKLAREGRAEKEERFRNDIAQTLAYAQLKMMWAHEVASQQPLLISQNPSVVCQAVKILKFAAPPLVKGGPEAFFLLNAGTLQVDTKLCFLPDELKKAVASYKEGLWGQYRVGADSPFIRKDPITKQLLSYRCDIDTTTNAGRQAGVCSLPKDVEGRIYRAEYVCADYKCGWSYGAKIGDYGQVVELKGREIAWSRIWDGDAHREGYILYYEKAQSGEPPSI